ncbi:MAG: DUF5683 domain-containing protein [Bacteroidia bacterium]|nr:DUF5683 domain-containing protein [Bacteroidia bacterium]
MRRFKSIFILIMSLVLLLPAQSAYAQFKSEAFSNGFGGEGDAAPADSAEAIFSIKEYFAGLSHKQELKIGTLAGGSAVFIGGQQIYNKQYWKLPIIYGGLGATVGGGFYYRNKYQKSLDAYNTALEFNPETPLTVDNKAKTMSTLMFAGGALVYWGAMMDGVISYPTDNPHHPGKATLYSILLPGLGQAYNGEGWKIPIYWGILLGTCHYLDANQTSYKRFKRIHNEATDPEGSYSEGISAQTALYYRDVYRRYRDWSVVAIAAAYLLQVIDANVFAYMQDFEVNDDISMDIRPALITPDTQYALNTGSTTAFGVSLGFRF